MLHFAVAVVAMLLSLASARAADCTATVTDVNFGNVDILSGGAVDATAEVTVSCTNALVLVSICPDLFAGSGGASAGVRQMRNGANPPLSYQLYQDAARTVVWGSGTAAPLMTILPVLGSGQVSRTLYARVFPNQPGIAAGDYTSIFDTSQTEFRYGTVTLLNCGVSVLGGVTRPIFAVHAHVQDNCSVTAEDINFGHHGVLSANVDATGGLDVTCTPGTNYTVGLNGGLSNAPPTQRLMTLGSEAVTYGLYKDPARIQPWGEAGGDAFAGTGSGTAQHLPVYGRVPPQPTPSPGTYTDTVVVTVTY